MKYWVYMNGEVPGCYTPQELGGLSGFAQTTLVCPAEGEILEKNWRRAGEFADIITILHERDAKKAPALSPQPEPAVGDVDALIDGASARLFSHVADLMKELENRREERALTQSVQRQLVDLKDQLTRAREEKALLESRQPRISELEEAVRKDQERIQSLELSLKAREDGAAELRSQLERSRTDLEAARRRLGEALNDLAIRNRLVDKLSRDLTEKELSLAKALGVIRRLEEDLHRLMPGSALAAAVTEAVAPVAQAPKPAAVEALPEIPVLPPAPPVPEAVAAAPAYTTDEPPAPAPLPELPAEAPAAQNAIIDVFKRFISSKDLHS